MSGPKRNRPQSAAFRRQLRQQGTPAENRLWACLRNRQLKGRKFKRQYSIGPFIVDFFCPEEHLAIELDGAVHNDPTRHAYDSERATYLTEAGIRLLRFENRQVFEQPEAVLDAIAQRFEAPVHQACVR